MLKIDTQEELGKLMTLCRNQDVGAIRVGEIEFTLNPRMEDVAPSVGRSDPRVETDPAEVLESWKHVEERSPES